MSTGPTPPSVIAEEYVQNDLQGPVDKFNSTAKSQYQLAFANWAIQQIGPPPPPPQLEVLNQALALQLFTVWSNTAFAAGPGVPVPGLDISSAISYVQAAPLQPTPPAIPPPPSDPVGPATGNYISWGGIQIPTFENVPGETPTQYPNGTPFTDSRGTFVHIEMPTPFGISSEWGLLPAAPAL